MEKKSGSQIFYLFCAPNGKGEWLVDLYILCVPNGNEECLVDLYLLCPEWKRREARRFISIVPLMEKKSGS